MLAAAQPPQAQQAQLQLYHDEEECLGIEAFANELELLLATGKQTGRCAGSRTVRTRAPAAPHGSRHPQCPTRRQGPRVARLACVVKHRVEQAQLLELLPKLAATIPKAQDKPLLKAMQKRCEQPFTELLNAGVCSTVRCHCWAPERLGGSRCLPAGHVHVAAAMITSSTAGCKAGHVLPHGMDEARVPQCAMRNAATSHLLGCGPAASADTPRLR